MRKGGFLLFFNVTRWRNNNIVIFRAYICILLMDGQRPRVKLGTCIFLLRRNGSVIDSPQSRLLNFWKEKENSNLMFINIKHFYLHSKLHWNETIGKEKKEEQEGEERRREGGGGNKKQESKS